MVQPIRREQKRDNPGLRTVSPDVSNYGSPASEHNNLYGGGSGSSAGETNFQPDLGPQPGAGGGEDAYDWGFDPVETPGPGIPLEALNRYQGLGQEQIQAVLRQMQTANQASQRAAMAGLGDISAQRAAANYDLRKGLRDARQQQEAAVEASTSNALQRGIYDSGIRQENQATAIREGAEARADLRAANRFRLRSLSARAAQIRAQAQAIAAQGNVNQAQTQYSMSQGLQGELLNFAQQYGIDEQGVAQLLGLINPNAQQGAPASPAGVRAQ